MSAPLVKQQPQITGFFASRSPLEFLGFSFITCMLALVSAGNPIGLAFIPLFALVWSSWNWWRDRRLAAATAFAVTKEPPQPAKGLILLLSPFDPRDPQLREQPILKPLLDRILAGDSLTEADFTAINLQGSNLLPQIRAAEYHLNQGSLRDLRLIATESYEIEQPAATGTKRTAIQGSEVTAVILENYLRLAYGTQQFDIHRGSDLMVKDYDYPRLWRITENIFRQASYKDAAIVADITGGTKMMSVAIAMACLSPQRRMQYMDAQRDWQGVPLAAGEMSPVMLEVGPMLNQSNGNP
jgi:hypothetical protein